MKIIDKIQKAKTFTIWKILDEDQNKLIYITMVGRENKEGENVIFGNVTVTPYQT